MATFPRLSTDAVLQYPAQKCLRYRNCNLRFLDGTEQRYRDAAGPLPQWIIRLNQLNETEMADLEQFFLANEGRFVSFTFTDPWTGGDYDNCSLASDEMPLTWQAEGHGSAALTIVQNRG